MVRSSLRRGITLAGLGVLVAGAACAPELDTSRVIPVRGTVGEEVYGVLCDRIGAQSLPEDLTGASFQAMCHKAPDGTWANTVALSDLPPITPDAVNTSGQPVSVAQQTTDRTNAVARIEALARDRTKLIAAFDATFPNISIPVKDLTNPDPTLSCDPATSGQRLSTQLSDMLGRMDNLYTDGTIPESTESLGRLMAAFAQDGDARDAYTRLSSRQGYRPINLALGSMRPMAAYPRLRNLANSTMSLLSSTSDPFASTTVPGAAYSQFTSMLGATYEELRTYAPSSPVPLLGAVTVDSVGREVLSRPRTDLELLQAVLGAQDPSFGSGDPQYIVQRDARGYATVALVNGQVPPPFVDADNDGLADVDSQGQFVTTNGVPAPTPFFAVGQPDAPARDAFGRALSAQGAAPIYSYMDTSHTYVAAMLRDTVPLVNPDPTQNHETLMNAMAGAYVLFGSRDGSAKSIRQYAPDPSLAQSWPLTHDGAPAPNYVGTAPVSLAYNAFHPDDAPMLDLVYALGQVMGDPTIDDTLQLSRTLMTQNTGALARIVSDALQVKSIADQHPEAKIPAQSTFWDEVFDLAVQIEQEPGLLEDLIRALGDDNTPNLGQIFSNYFSYDDQITYDTNDLNGPPYNASTRSSALMQTPVNRSKPDAGFNRSAFQRFVQLIHDTNGLTVCNKNNAFVDAQLGPLAVTLPLVGGGYSECEVFMINNAAKFYVDSIVGKAQLYLRDDLLRNGVGGLSAATVGLMEQSSGITGFVGENTSSVTLFPTPQFLDRLLFFDIANDSPNLTDPNYVTNHFLSDLLGVDGVGTTVCPERSIPDPCVDGNSNSCSAQPYTSDSGGNAVPDFGSAGPDGIVHGLRTCPDSESAFKRDNDTIFVWEDFGFYAAMTPLINAFVNHKREDLFLGLMEVFHRHWADANGAASECLLSSGAGSTQTCSKDGVVSYEPLLAQALTTDLLPALHDLEQTLEGVSVSHCDAIDPTSHQCTQAESYSGITVLANATRALLDPGQAQQIGLTDRHGSPLGRRNDGSTNAQVTPAYLLTDALDDMDAAFTAYAKANPKDSERQTLWRSARSQLVDQFLGVTGTTFNDPSLPAIAPVLIDTLRAQIFANCPATFSSPSQPCAWARTQITQTLSAVVGGPLFAGAVDLLDAMRANQPARTQAEQLMTYMLDPNSQDDALLSMLASTNDLMQVMQDDTNIVPFFHVLAVAAAPSVVDVQGNILQKGLIDAQMSLLSRVGGKFYAPGSTTELCSAEVDPNGVLEIATKNLVTPTTLANGAMGESPMESIIDVIADVNRAAPAQTTKLTSGDYSSIGANVVDFLMNKEEGLEQFYAIMRNGLAAE